MNKPDMASKEGMTQFGRVLADINVAVLCANAHQPKGRVERTNQTLEERLARNLEFMPKVLLPAIVAE